MKTLVIPDLHHRVGHADRIIAAHPDADLVVFLGDYFDNFGDGPREAAATARWLRAHMEARPQDVFLLGNHDVPYRWPGVPEFGCSGYAPSKQRVIDEILKPEHWARFRLCYWERGAGDNDPAWLLSHAGITDWLFRPAVGPAYDKSRVRELCRRAIAQADAGIPELVLSAIGNGRGGRCQSGGITWQCWSEFNPTPGINQIVGHTPDRTVRQRTRPLVERMLGGRFYTRVEDEEAEPVSENWCLDTHTQHYGILEDGRLSIHATPTDAQLGFPTIGERKFIDHTTRVVPNP